MILFSSLSNPYSYMRMKLFVEATLLDYSLYDIVSILSSRDILSAYI